jgi:signal transduction histidine kinase/DNA-binding response OmpR family regulator
MTAAPPHASPSEGGPVHVLHVGQHPADADRARHHLHAHGARFAFEGALTGADCLARLTRDGFDVLLVADRPTDMTGIDLLRAVRARRPSLPVVFLLRERDEQAAADAVRLGAFDYLVEPAGDLVKLPLVLEHAAVQRRLFRESASLARQRKLLAALREGGDVDRLLGGIACAARELLEVEWALVLLVEEGDILVPRAWSGGLPRALAGVRFPARTGRWGPLWSAMAPVRLDPIAVTEPWSVSPTLDPVDSTLAVPLAARGRRLGALLLAAGPTRHFGAQDEDIVRMLADLAGLAVDTHGLTDELVHAQRLATVGRMVAGVAHELNNPLAVIMGTLDLLRYEPLADRFADRLARVTAQAQRAVKIVRTLLALARKQAARRTAVDVNTLLADTLELAAYDLKRADVRVVQELSDAVPPVAADPDQLQQVFTNLFLNACHAMREAHGQGTLTVATDLDPGTDRVRVTVGDDGPGIAPEHLPRIFEPFFTTKGEGHGTGLGLAICRRIVEHHGGAISVASRPGEGARFTLELPAWRGVVSQPAAVGLPPRPQPAGARVLVVEDEPLVGDMVADLLSLEGHEVDRATNGREALEMLARRAYALIVSDVRMPDLSGTAFYRELCRLDPALARRVVFVTGDALSPETRRFFDETRLAYLEKPFAVADFQSAIRRALEAT